MAVAGHRSDMDPKEVKGSYFNVEIYPDGRVVKTPRNRKGAEVSQERLQEIARLQNQLSELFPEVLPCKYIQETGQLETKEAPGEYGGNPGGRPHTMDFEMWREVALPKLNRVHSNIKALGYVFRHDELGVKDPENVFNSDAKQRHNIKYDAENDRVYLIDFHDIEYRGVAGMEDKLIQAVNPKTGNYVKIETATGKIVAEKKSAGPYKGIKEIVMVETETPIPAPDKPPPGERPAKDPTRRWFGKKYRPAGQ